MKCYYEKEIKNINDKYINEIDSLKNELERKVFFYVYIFLLN